jgi:hypothetical protein
VDLHPEEKTAFLMGQGLWNSTVMPSGFCKASVTFERLMEIILTVLTYGSRLVYLYDVIVIGRKFQEYLLNLRKVFQRFLTLNPKKCQLFRKKYSTSSIVSPEGITIDSEKLKAIREWPTPKNKHEIRSFLGL